MNKYCFRQQDEIQFPGSSEAAAPGWKSHVTGSERVPAAAGFGLEGDN